MKYAHVAIALALTSTAVAGVYAETRHAPVVIDLLKPDTRTVGDVLVSDKPEHAIVDAYLDPLDDPQLMYPKANRVMEQGELTMPACSYCSLPTPEVEGPSVSAEGELYPGHGTIEGAEIVPTPKATVTIEGIAITEAPTQIARNR